MLEFPYLQELVKDPEKITNLDFSIVERIIELACGQFSKEDLMLELNLKDDEKTALIIGDIHGNLQSLLYFINIIRKKKPSYVLFLGDIVDRGKNQLQCLILIIILKIISPNLIYLLRGNHENIEMNQFYGFYYDFIERYRNQGSFEKILSLYELLPVCAIINNEIFCVHGGIPTDFSILDKIKKKKGKELNSFSTSVRENIFQMMWNDPKEGLKGFSPSFRGNGIYFYGEDVFSQFIEQNNLRYMIRSHECFLEGYRWFFKKRLLSIFSSSKYRRSNPASFALIKANEILPFNADI